MRRSPRRNPRHSVAASALAGVATALVAFPAAAAAHAPLVGKQDIPIPEWLFAWGASLVLIVSFVALTLAWQDSALRGGQVAGGLGRTVASARQPGDGRARRRPRRLPPGARGLRGPPGDRVARPQLRGHVRLLDLLAGPGVGLGVCSATSSGRSTPGGRSRGRSQACSRRWRASRAPPPLRYPERLGRWPAVAGIAAFAWFELVYALSGFQAVGLPRTASPSPRSSTPDGPSWAWRCSGSTSGSSAARPSRSTSTCSRACPRSRCATGGLAAAAGCAARPGGRRSPARSRWCCW